MLSLLQFQALAPLSLIAVQSRNLMVAHPVLARPWSSVGKLVVAGNPPGRPRRVSDDRNSCVLIKRLTTSSTSDRFVGIGLLSKTQSHSRGHLAKLHLMTAFLSFARF